MLSSVESGAGGPDLKTTKHGQEADHMAIRI